MGIEVVIVSHRRAGRVTTHRYVANARVCVPEAQLAEYSRYHPEETLLGHPDAVVGLPAKRQWVCETLGDVMMLDDDSVGLYRLYRPKGGRRRMVCSAGRAYDLIQETAETARSLGAYLFGFASHVHAMTFQQHRPFKFGGYSPGGAMGLLKGSRLTWPAEVPGVGEDYWICLLNAYYHRYAWYDLRFAFGFRNTYRGIGGLAEFWTEDAEEEATRYLVKQFGAVLQAKKQRGMATKRQWNRYARRINMPYKV